MVGGDGPRTSAEDSETEMPKMASKWVVSAEAILAHLFYVVYELELVTVHLGGRSVPGILTRPDPESRTLGFRPEARADFGQEYLRTGRTMRVEYASLDDEYRFLAVLNLVEDNGVWRLSIPRQIDRQDRRIVPRQLVRSTRQFTVRVQGPTEIRHMLVHDISIAGFAFVFDPKMDPLREGAIYRTTLFLPDGETILTRARICNVRRIPDSPELRIAGCRFVGLGYFGCARMGAALFQYEEG